MVVTDMIYCIWLLHTYPVCLWIKKEVGPVWISLHVPELKELPQAQFQNLLTDLEEADESIMKGRE